MYSCQILNATTVVEGSSKSAFEVFHNKRPYFGKLYPFGTPCYFLDQSPNLRKLQPRGKPGYLVGLNAGTFGYRIWEKGTRRIVITKHVTFSKKSPLSTNRDNLEKEAERAEIFKPKQNSYNDATQPTTKESPSNDSSNYDSATGSDSLDPEEVNPEEVNALQRLFNRRLKKTRSPFDQRRPEKVVRESVEMKILGKHVSEKSVFFEIVVL